MDQQQTDDDEASNGEAEDLAGVVRSLEVADRESSEDSAAYMGEVPSNDLDISQLRGGYSDSSYSFYRGASGKVCYVIGGPTGKYHNKALRLPMSVAEEVQAGGNASEVIEGFMESMMTKRILPAYDGLANRMLEGNAATKKAISKMMAVNNGPASYGFMSVLRTINNARQGYNIFVFL